MGHENMSPRSGKVYRSDGTVAHEGDYVTPPAYITGDLAIVLTAGERTQLPDIPCRQVMLIGLRANTGYVYVGGAAVSSTAYGAELAAKDSVVLEVSNANLIYIDASVSGEGVSYFAI